MIRSSGTLAHILTTGRYIPEDENIQYVPFCMFVFQPEMCIEFYKGSALSHSLVSHWINAIAPSRCHIIFSAMGEYGFATPRFCGVTLRKFSRRHLHGSTKRFDSCG
jgi:hypothetical protein